jgi:hypothetical protein
MSVVCGFGPGVDNVNTPHVTWAAAKVLVQEVCDGPVMEPPRYSGPNTVEPVQVAAVFPSRSHSRCAVLGAVSDAVHIGATSKKRGYAHSLGVRALVYERIRPFGKDKGDVAGNLAAPRLVGAKHGVGRGGFVLVCC